MKNSKDQDDLFNPIEADLFHNEFLIDTENEVNNKFVLTSEDEIMSKMSTPPSSSFFDNLEAIDREHIGDLPIECFLIKDKGIKALQDIGILTLFDLKLINDYIEDAPNGIERIGRTGHRVIQEQYDYFISNRGKISLKKFMDDYLDDKQRSVLDLRYGLTGTRHTLEEVGANYSVTRERVRQIEKKAIERLRRGIQYGLIDSRARSTLYYCADHLMSLRELLPLPADFSKEGTAYLYSAAIPAELLVYKNENLKEVVLIRTHKKDYYDRKIESIRRYLSEQSEPVSITDAQEKFNCSRSLIMSLANLVVIDDRVTLSTNKRASGVSKVHNIIELLRKAEGPLSIDEIAKATNYEPGSVRGVVFHSSEIVNVGQSIYALKEHGYLNLDTDGMMRHLLTQHGEPILTTELIASVKEYRRVTDSAIYRILTERPEDFQQLEGGYVALREWGHENEIEYTSRRYVVSPTDAIIGVLEVAEVPMSPQEILMTMEMMYREETSLNPTTLYAALKRLVEEGVIEKTGDSRSTFYELM